MPAPMAQTCERDRGIRPTISDSRLMIEDWARLRASLPWPDETLPSASELALSLSKGRLGVGLRFGGGQAGRTAPTADSNQPQCMVWAERGYAASLQVAGANPEK